MHSTECALSQLRHGGRELSAVHGAVSGELARAQTGHDATQGGAVHPPGKGAWAAEGPSGVTMRGGTRSWAAAVF
jgi:hypothetical protein